MPYANQQDWSDSRNCADSIILAEYDAPALSDI